MNAFNKILYARRDHCSQTNKIENTSWALLEMKPPTLFSESYLVYWDILCIMVFVNVRNEL